MISLARMGVVALVLIATALSAGDVRADEISTVYYRDPDATNSNLVEIRKAFTAAAREQGVNIELQPISQHRRFLAALLGVKSGFVLMPSWVRLSSKSKLETLVVGHRKGSTTFKHVVLEKEGTVQAGASIQIAGVIDSEYWEQIVTANAPAQLKAGTFIEVPKHLDGIMALSYGQVQYSVLPDSAVQTIRKEVPNLLKGIVVLYETAPQTNLSLFAMGAPNASQKSKVTRFFETLVKQKRGRELLRLLGYDALKVPSAKVPSTTVPSTMVPATKEPMVLEAAR